VCEEATLVDIVVCVKQVPDTTAKKELVDGFRLNRAMLESVLNPFDEYAIEEAIRQKEVHGGEVTMLTMGPPSAEETMRKGLAMGVDRGVLVTDPALAGSDIWATAYVLAAALRQMSFDLILCGQESADARTGLLAGGLAEHLGLPMLSYAQKLEIVDGTVRIHRQMPGGYQVVAAPLPALVTVVKAINEPRYPSLKGIMSAKRKEITKRSLEDLGIAPNQVGTIGSHTEVVAANPRPEKTHGQIITEPPEVAAKLIADFLQERKFI
jgi:electron transfer flavoprotein beta subunit